MRHIGKILSALTCLAALNGAEVLQLNGEWRCVALTPRHLALTGDYTGQQQAVFSERFSARRLNLPHKKLAKWMEDQCFNFSATEAVAEIRSRVVEALRDDPKVTISSSANTPVLVEKTGYWLNPIGLIQ